MHERDRKLRAPAFATVIGRNLLQPAQFLLVVSAACLGAAACTPRQQEPADTKKDVGQVVDAKRQPGLIYAESACAECHAVAAGQTQSPNPKAPTFESIANTPGVTRMGLSALLRTSHRTMPNLIVEPDRIDDLSAYLETLRK